MINKFDIGYAAGVFDSEGSLYIERRGISKKSVRKDNWNRTLHIFIWNTNKNLLNWFKEKFDGRIFGPYIRKEYPQRKPQWKWFLCVSRGAEKFLRLIKDHTIEKKVKIKEAIKFCEKYKPKKFKLKSLS